MSEDGELSESPLEDSFMIDRNQSVVISNDDDSIQIIEDEGKEEGETPSENATSPSGVQGSGGNGNVTGGGGESTWMKEMRKRLLEPTSTTPDEEEPQTKRRRVNLCFNCRGEHSIAQCPEPKDFQAIRKNKQEFLNDKNQNQSGGRISKITEKEAKFKPGRLSQSLRDALKLGPDDIPEWVYRMRKLGFHRGYPPGYLRKSLKHEFETIKIFSEDSKEDPELDESKRPAPSIQSDKIHFYMGFNKSYRALRDRENGRFEVPPFDVFCDMLQKEVTYDHEVSEKYRLRDDRQRRSELLKKREEIKQKETEEMEKNGIISGDGEGKEDDDVFIIDRKTTKEEEKVEDQNGNEGESKREETPVPVEKMGESIHQLIGTPIISRRDASGTWINETTPTLEAFSVGIVPFEAREEEKPRGIFKRIMSTLRGEKKADEKEKEEENEKK